MPKRSIRSQLLTQRNALAAEKCRAWSELIQQQLIDSRCFDGATRLALYSAVRNEVSTSHVARAAKIAGKQIAYPRVAGGEIEFVTVSGSDDLAPGAYGVSEPRGSAVVPTTELDLVIVPGVAFDTDGHRLGYGRGYYDRALAGCRQDCMKVGFAYEFQVLVSLPRESHDQAVTMLVTEKSVLEIPPVDATDVQVK
jgi:5-formyltetrahydrofolate cyclo-ligase